MVNEHLEIANTKATEASDPAEANLADCDLVIIDVSSMQGERDPCHHDVERAEDGKGRKKAVSDPTSSVGFTLCSVCGDLSERREKKIHRIDFDPKGK